MERTDVTSALIRAQQPGPRDTHNTEVTQIRIHIRQTAHTSARIQQGLGTRGARSHKQVTDGLGNVQKDPSAEFILAWGAQHFGFQSEGERGVTWEDLGSSFCVSTNH